MFANNCIPFLIGTLSDLFSAYAFALNKEVQREERKDQQKTTAQQLVASIQGPVWFSYHIIAHASRKKNLTCMEY